MRIVILLLAIAIVISGCISQQPQQEEKRETRIGALLPLTGPIAHFGRFPKEGIEIAVEDINDTSLKIIYEDVQLCSTQLSVSGARKLIEIDKVSSIISLCAETALGIAPIAEESRIVSFSVGALPDSVTNAGDYTFRNQVTASYEGKVLTDFAKSRFNAIAAALFYVKNDYGAGVKDGFKKSWTESGGTIVAEEGSETNDKDFRTQITKIKAANPDIVFAIPQFHGIFLKQAKELGLDKPILSIQTTQNPDTINVAGNAADGVFYTYPLDEDNLIERQKEFTERFEKKYGYLPQAYSLNAYDAVMILYDLAKRCDGNSTCVKDRLYQTKDYNGVEGIISFDENGDVIKKLVIKTVRNATFVRLE